MIKTSIKDGLSYLDGNWLKITGIILLCYLVKSLISTLPIQGTVSLQMSPLEVVSSNTLISLGIASVVNSILFFIMIDYITLTQHTMPKRFVTALTFPFRNWKLLFKGLIVFFISYLLIDIIGTMSIYAGFGTFLTYASEGNLWVGLLALAYLLLFSLVIWLFLGISQAMYILYDNPEDGIFSSIKKSYTFMKGYRWPLLGLLVLSGIGMVIGVLLFVVGAILCLVLFEVARLAFYRNLLQKRRQQEWQAKVNQ